MWVVLLEDIFMTPSKQWKADDESRDLMPRTLVDTLSKIFWG